MVIIVGTILLYQIIMRHMGMSMKRYRLIEISNSSQHDFKHSFFNLNQESILNHTCSWVVVVLVTSDDGLDPELLFEYGGLPLPKFSKFLYILSHLVISVL